MKNFKTLYELQKVDRFTKIIQHPYSPPPHTHITTTTTTTTR